MTSFQTITAEDYKKLIANERKIFDLSENFTTPEILNKYRHSDKNVDNKIKEDEKENKKYNKLDELINKNIEKLKEDDNRSNISVLNENDYYYEDPGIYTQTYRFDSDDNIINSFNQIFKKYGIDYKPREDTKYYRIKYFLNKLKENENIPSNLYNHVHTELSENNKTYHIIPIEKAESSQTGGSINNIVINNEDLNKGILKIRYLNNRKLTNPILNKDYRISKNMVNAIKYNKDIHKLSKNENESISRITKSFK